MPWCVQWLLITNKYGSHNYNSTKFLIWWLVEVLMGFWRRTNCFNWLNVIDLRFSLFTQPLFRINPSQHFEIEIWSSYVQCGDVQELSRRRNYFEFHWNRHLEVPRCSNSNQDEACLTIWLISIWFDLPETTVEYKNIREK